MDCYGCIHESIKGQPWSSSLPHPCSGCSRAFVNNGDKYQKAQPIYMYPKYCPHCGKEIVV